jgi:hypothetical protein
LWSAAESILRGRLGVDVIALLAVAGAVAVGELLAAAVISVMLTSGRFLEAWAAERARHEWRLEEMRAIALRLRARILRLRCLTCRPSPQHRAETGHVELVQIAQQRQPARAGTVGEPAHRGRELSHASPPAVPGVVARPRRRARRKDSRGMAAAPWR